MTGFDSLFNDHRSRPLIIAHRGAGHRGKDATAHENTIAAFEAAVAAGADGIEVDVRRTADGVLIIHHDLRFPGQRLSIPIMSHAEAKKAAGMLGFAVPTLEETVRFCSGRMLLDVELKEAGYEAEVLAACHTMMRKSRVVFTSFYPVVVAAIKSIAPEAKAGLLVGLRQAGKSLLRRGGRAPLALAQDCGADVIAPHWRLATASFCRRAHDAGLPVVVWTVDKGSLIGGLRRKNVGAIITNHPDRIIPA
ncbi:MAG: glycerophosphodiester phosphodiesterase [candidate division Zixibacteria bacterium]|nr:glycerophosphodiester phosphodiesterase [candidate division Zixibacteria bacterium]